MRWIVKCRSPCFIHLKHYFLNFSSFFTQYWASKYDVCDIFNNDFDALVSIIKFVQQREPSSMFFFRILMLLTCIFFMSLYSRILLHSVKCI